MGITIDKILGDALMHDHVSADITDLTTTLDPRYLKIASNLSDLNNVATARTNLGLVAGGTGDIWVEKAGDTMTGNLSLGTYNLTAGSQVVSIANANTDTLLNIGSIYSATEANSRAWTIRANKYGAGSTGYGLDIVYTGSTSYFPGFRVMNHATTLFSVQTANGLTLLGNTTSILSTEVVSTLALFVSDPTKGTQYEIADTTADVKTVLKVMHRKTDGLASGTGAQIELGAVDGFYVTQAPVVAGAMAGVRVSSGEGYVTLSHRTGAALVETIRLTGGRMGVGTTAPSEKIHVIGNYQLSDAVTPTKSYRFRTTGSGLDFDGAGQSIYLSVYDNADFTGTQRQYMIFGHLYDYVTCFRNWEWKDSSSNVQAQINPNGGFVFNEGGTSNLDFRVESDTEANMLLLDADGNTNGTLYIGGNSLTTAHSSRKGGLFFPVQAPTASAPTYVIGAIYFDTTLNKLRIGGAAGWETVTSV